MNLLKKGKYEMKKGILLIFISFITLFSMSVFAKGEYKFTTSEEIIAIGDIHGAYEAFVTALKNMEVIDDELNWAAGKKHFVSLGDMIDRGADSRKVMDLLIKLQEQAAKAGGKVHVVLGNHEVMNLKGDLRYVSKPEYLAFAKDESSDQRKAQYKKFLEVYRAKDSKKVRAQFEAAFPKGYFAYVDAFRADGHYGKWILSLPFVIQINDQLFAHGGLSESVANKSLQDINQELRDTINRYLSSWDKIQSRSKTMFYPPFKERFRLVEKLGRGVDNRQFTRTENSLLFSQMGPTWYRGNAVCHPYYESDKLGSILKSLEVTRLWVGHTPTYNLRPMSRLDDQLVVLDTGMLKAYYGGKPYVAKIQTNGEFKVYNGLSAKLSKAKVGPNRENANPFGLPDKQMKVVLKNAKVADKKGKSKDPEDGQVLTMDYDGHKFNARFFSYDDKPDAQSAKWSDSLDSAKRYQYELAAFKLDRLLGIGLVPLTIEKEIDGVKGALQVLPEKLVSFSRLRKEFNGQLGVCKTSDQQNLKDVFDYLIQNRIGRLGESYFSKSDGQIWFLGHSESFDSSTRFTAKSRPDEVFVSSRFKKALLALDKEQLKVLEQWLHPKKVEAIWLRRQRLLDL